MVNLEQSQLDFINDLISKKDADALTWQQIADICNLQFGFNFSESYYRKNFQNSERAESIDDLIRIRKEKVKLSDERIQANAYIRRLAREETIKEIAKEFANTMNSKKLLQCNVVDESEINRDFFNINKKEAILQISDWHYGIEIDSYFNKYNPEIAKDRILALQKEVIYRCKENNIHKLHVVNLSDLIAGRIHLQLRLESRFDVIQQIMEVSEILAEFLTNIQNENIEVHYYDCLDNHSRLEPNKKDAIALESLVRIITWYLKDRCPNVNIHENSIAPDIITFNVLGHNVVGVHGDNDKPVNVVDNLTLLTHQHYDLMLTAHNHHFYADEKNETIVVGNGSLMGTDSFAEKLRLSAKPSQNLVIITEKNVIDSLYRILV